MRSIALTNQKGGVGKTTSTANLGAALAALGRKVLMVDVDPQANLSAHFGVNTFEAQASVYYLLIGQARFEDVVIQTAAPGLQLIPSNINLAGAEIELVSMVGRETILKAALVPAAGKYDYLLIDCPPSLGLLTLNALTSVNEVFVPLQTEFFALQGMSKLLETVEMVRRRLNHQLRVAGIIACMFDGRTRLSREVLENIREYFKEKVFRTVIRKNVKLAESPSHGRPITEYAPRSRGTKDYVALAKEVIAQEKEMTDESGEKGEGIRV